jgi:hypothetical protein
MTTTSDLEKPVFELRLVNDHVLKMEGLFKSLPEETKPLFLQLTRLLPPLLFGETSEEKLLFVRIFVVLRSHLSPENMQLLIRAATQANDTLFMATAAAAPPPSTPSGEFSSRVQQWKQQPSGSLRQWADVFEAATKSE